MRAIVHSQYSIELAIELAPSKRLGRRASVSLASTPASTLASAPRLHPRLHPTPHQVAPNKRLRPVESVRPSVRLDGPPPTGTGKRKCGRAWLG